MNTVGIIINILLLPDGGEYFTFIEAVKTKETYFGGALLYKFFSSSK